MTTFIDAPFKRVNRSESNTISHCQTNWTLVDSVRSSSSPAFNCYNFSIATKGKWRQWAKQKGLTNAYPNGNRCPNRNPKPNAFRQVDKDR